MWNAEGWDWDQTYLNYSISLFEFFPEFQKTRQVN